MLRMMGGSLDGHEHNNGTLTRPAPIREDGPMDQDRARSLLIAERDEVQGLLKDAEAAGLQDRQAEVDSEAGDTADAAQPLAAEGQDDAIAESLRSRLDAIERALRRLDDGTYGRSVRSGEPIPDERLEADPAAELTVDEARAAERG
jgi:DnaK suppressor protein